MSAKFEVGKTYSTGEGRDYVWRFTVVSRAQRSSSRSATP
jgi:hypothetical protein